jgi:tellurite methyltransferase
MSKNWEELWREDEKTIRWSMPDYHVLYHVEQCGDITNYKALDIGAGIGRHTNYLLQKGCIVDAVEPTDSSIAWLTALKMDNLTIVKNDLVVLKDYRDNLFEIVIAWNVIYHLKFDEIVAAIHDVYRVLKPGGKFLLTLNSVRNIHFGKGMAIEKNTFIKQSKLDGEHVHHYSDQHEVDVLLKDFEILSVEENEEIVGNKFFKDRWHWYIVAQKNKH